jgi:GNAT superfamily N-acetyltransferase
MIAPYPSELEDHVTLSNQRRLHIRPLRRCDDLPIRELDAGLSLRTRYLRFFLPMPTLPESVLSLLACVDYRRRLALLGEVEVAHGVEVVALGNYGATDEGTVELGLVVRDDWQRRGIGIALTTRVLQAAEARGFDRFVGHVLCENVVVRRLLNRVGRIVSTETHEGVSEVSFVRRQQGA